MTLRCACIANDQPGHSSSRPPKSGGRPRFFQLRRRVGHIQERSLPESTEAPQCRTSHRNPLVPVPVTPVASRRQGNELATMKHTRRQRTTLRQPVKKCDSVLVVLTLKTSAECATNHEMSINLSTKLCLTVRHPDCDMGSQQSATMCTVKWNSVL